MGGDGSGRYPRLGRAKTTVSRCRQFGVDWMHDEGLLRPGSAGAIRWTRERDDEETASIGYRTVGAGDARRVVLSYTSTNRHTDTREEYEYAVPITTTPCNFGGERPWFRCPGSGCGERVGKLYSVLGSGYYLCRHCHDLGYKSSQKSGDPFHENIMKPLEAADDAADAFAAAPLDREALREYYEARKTLDRGFAEEFDSPTSPGFRGTSSFEEWADRLLAQSFGYGHYGQCTATAKTTGERCRQSARGEHGKCYYHGGAPGSGIGDEQRDHAAKRLEALLEDVEEQRRRDRERTRDLLDANGSRNHDHDGGATDPDANASSD